MTGCGCNYWRELIKSAWGLATTSVRAVRTKNDLRYPDGDGVLDISDISGGVDGGVTSVNGKNPDDRGAVTVTGADITTPATGATIDESISVLHNLVSQEQSARSTADRDLEASINGKQDVLTGKQQKAVDSGITTQKIAKYDAYDAQIISNSNAIKTSSDDIAQLKISDSEHTSAISDMGTQIDAQATEITAIKTKNASQDSDISALKTKTSSHDTEIQGLSESVVSDLTGEFTESTRTLSLSLERESAPSIDCSIIIPGGTGGGDVTSVNGKTGAVNLGASDVLTSTQFDAVMSGITAPKVSQYNNYASQINAKADASTVAQIQTTVGGCFNDASISGNSLVLGTVGGQQNTLTLPGGTSGGLKITRINWNKLGEWLGEIPGLVGTTHMLLVNGYLNISTIKQDPDGVFPGWNDPIEGISVINYSGGDGRTLGIDRVYSTGTQYFTYSTVVFSGVGISAAIRLPLSLDAWDTINNKGGITADIIMFNGADKISTSIKIELDYFEFYIVESS